jgi:predicted amidohydrolase
MAKDQNLKLALIQAPLVWQDPGKNRDNLEKMIRAVSGDTDLVILPEMFTTGFTMSPAEVDEREGPRALEWMQEMAGISGAAITGSIAYHHDQLYTNRLFFVFPTGAYEYYDKRHTFSLAGEDKVYGAGFKRLITEYKGFMICPMICYDLRFPVWTRNTDQYDVLLFVANWPKPRILAWDTLLRARAIENQSYCIGVNRIGEDPNGHEYPGHSAVYDSLGAQLAFSEKEGVIYATLSKIHITGIREKLRFLEDRDHFNLQ